MYELYQALGNSYYIQSPAKIGLVRLDENKVCLIDSGNDKDAGRRVRKLLDEKDWKLTAIYNTHANADHNGGNRYLQQQTGCKIYAPGIDCAVNRHPILEPAFLYGAFPPKELRHKFLLAQDSDTEYLTKDKLPEGMEAIELPGHFFNMVGYRTADDVVYLADCLSSRETLEKYQVAFIYDVAAYLDTLEKVKTMEAKLFIPSHAEATENIAPLAQYNIDKVNEIAERMLEMCREPLMFEELLQKLFKAYELTLNFEQYALVGSTVRSFLTWLKESGRMEAVFDDCRLLWRSL